MAGNLSLMAEVVKEGWQKGDESKAGVKSYCKIIQDKHDKYNSDEERREDAKYIYEHIDYNELGKGRFSQLLLGKIEKRAEVKIPDYIKKAIIWACGGNIDE